jgi:hypothetical protein
MYYGSYLFVPKLVLFEILPTGWLVHARTNLMLVYMYLRFYSEFAGGSEEKYKET